MSPMLAKPVIPQTKIRFVGETAPRIPPSAGATVAVPVIHDWGPLGSELTKVQVLAQFAEWLDTYGDSDTPGRTAMAEAFVGQGISGAAGAGGVIPFRMGTNAARATKVLQNTAGTPANAITLTGIWTGERGNSLSVQIDANPDTAATQDRLRIRFKGAVVETYVYNRTDITALAAAINVRSTWIRATGVTSGTGLALTAGSALGGGTNGDAVTAADCLAALAALEYQPFSLLAFYDLTDAAMQAAVLSWVRAQDEGGRPVIVGFGGAAGETIDTAIARSTALADPHVINLGVGTYFDDLLQRNVSTSQLVPRIMGIMAARGKKAALTGAEVGGLHIVGGTGVTTDAAIAAIRLGVTVLIRTDSPEADLRIAKGVTTFTSTSDAARPLDIFSDPRLVRIMDLFVRDMKQWGDRKMIGAVPVNQDSRDATVAKGGELIGDLRQDGLILGIADGATADPFIRCPVTTDDTIPFDFGWQFARTANYLLGDGRVR